MECKSGGYGEEALTASLGIVLQDVECEADSSQVKFAWAGTSDDGMDFHSVLGMESSFASLRVLSKCWAKRVYSTVRQVYWPSLTLLCGSFATCRDCRLHFLFEGGFSAPHSKCSGILLLTGWGCDGQELETKEGMKKIEIAQAAAKKKVILPPQKDYTRILKDLCASRGTTWALKRGAK